MSADARVLDSAILSALEKGDESLLLDAPVVSKGAVFEGLRPFTGVAKGLDDALKACAAAELLDQDVPLPTPLPLEVLMADRVLKFASHVGTALALVSGLTTTPHAASLTHAMNVARQGGGGGTLNFLREMSEREYSPTETAAEWAGIEPEGAFRGALWALLRDIRCGTLLAHISVAGACAPVRAPTTPGAPRHRTFMRVSALLQRGADAAAGGDFLARVEDFAGDDSSSVGGDLGVARARRASAAACRALGPLHIVTIALLDAALSSRAVIAALGAPRVALLRIWRASVDPVSRTLLPTT